MKLSKKDIMAVAIARTNEHNTPLFYKILLIGAFPTFSLLMASSALPLNNIASAVACVFMFVYVAELVGVIVRSERESKALAKKLYEEEND